MSETLQMTCARNPKWAAEEIERLKAELAQRSETRPTFKQQDADMLAAAVDAAIRRGYIDPRSEIADCRLDYGQPFTPEEVAAHLSRRRHGKNAALNPAAAWPFPVKP